MPLDRTLPLNSLGFAKAPADTRVVVAMSGGVDSSVVAAMLAEEGYDVVGVTLQLYDHGAALARKGACCAGIDIHDARRVAETMGFPHYVLDYENVFKDAVIDEFADSYLGGATPVPCIPLINSITFAFRLVIYPPKMTPVPWPPNTGSMLPTSPTVRISASCQMAITRLSSGNYGPKRRSPGILSIPRAVSSRDMTA